jgi:hypothetical protein
MPDVHYGMPSVGAVWPGGASKQGPHRVGAFAICAQLEAFGYQLNLRPNVEKDAPKIGTLVHVGLAYRYGVLLDVKPDWLVYPDARWAIWICGQDRPDCAAEALRIYDSYVAHYDPLIAAGVVPAWKPLLVEHQFEVSFVMPDGSVEPYTARIDLMVECQGEILLVDHKTGSKISNHSGKHYSADRQMLTQLALARQAGHNVSRVFINAMSREYPQPRFGRFEVPISHEAYGHLGQDTAWALEQINIVRKRFPDPMNRPRSWESCMRKYGQCDFSSLCTDGLHRLVEYVKRT